MTEPFKTYLSLSTAAVVGIEDRKNHEKGVVLHFVNPLLAPHDLSPCQTWDDEHGRHTAFNLGIEACLALRQAIDEWVAAKSGTGLLDPFLETQEGGEG